MLDLMMEIFIEHPLALPGSAKNIKTLNTHIIKHCKL
jgi:hypothetical protein